MSAVKLGGFAVLSTIERRWYLSQDPKALRWQTFQFPGEEYVLSKCKDSSGVEQWDKRSARYSVDLGSLLHARHYTECLEM